MVPFRVDVLSVEEWEYLMPTTAKNVPSKRKTGMVVQMNTTMVPFRVDVLSVEEWEYLMPTTAKNVPSKRKTDGCPKVVNLGSAKTDLFYERKKYGYKKI
ncbi:hypothetical protein Ddye_022497 [Dipteronia dyeriana]|uniref:Uncharacterized protein n=1 Tax=Dipteronia dyeriana TaxID=168575 RepID=A0AAD9TR48_9ROSI|nr:hypothetical protein Ddye_022497 [Dipteronia dyeriana]